MILESCCDYRLTQSSKNNLESHWDVRKYINVFFFLTLVIYHKEATLQDNPVYSLMLCPGCGLLFPACTTILFGCSAAVLLLLLQLNGKYRRRVLITQPGCDASLFKHTEHRVGARAVEGASARHIQTRRCRRLQPSERSHQRSTAPLLCSTCVPALAVVYFSFSLNLTLKLKD